MSDIPVAAEVRDTNFADALGEGLRIDGIRRDREMLPSPGQIGESNVDDPYIVFLDGGKDVIWRFAVECHSFCSLFLPSWLR